MLVTLLLHQLVENGLVGGLYFSHRYPFSFKTDRPRVLVGCVPITGIGSNSVFVFSEAFSGRLWAIRVLFVWGDWGGVFEVVLVIQGR